MSTASVCAAAFVVTAGIALAAQSPQTVTTNLGKDAQGNTLRLATKTGHVSNYDETKTGWRS